MKVRNMRQLQVEGENLHSHSPLLWWRLETALGSILLLLRLLQLPAQGVAWFSFGIWNYGCG